MAGNLPALLQRIGEAVKKTRNYSASMARRGPVKKTSVLTWTA